METNEELVAEARRLLHQSPVTDPAFQQKVVALVATFEEVRNALQDQLDPEGTRTKRPTEWADHEVDTAIKDYLFWWVWGN